VEKEQVKMNSDMMELDFVGNDSKAMNSNLN
jgi:hypothetical protein